MSVSNESPLDASMEEGMPLRVNEWGTPGMWVLCLIMALCSFLTFWSAIQGNAGAFASSAAFLIFGLFCGRVAMLGLIIEEDGVKVRTYGKTIRMTWTEVAGFELRDTVYRASLRVERVDGTVIGVQGIAPRTSSEKDRAQRIWHELQQRLAEQRAK
jgi:hypothetical protein